MGFISSSSTVTLTAYLTQKGRELLLTGNEADITTAYFAFGDSDTNYKVISALTSGYVIDLSGDDTGNIKSLADGVGIKHFVIQSGKTDNKKEIRFQKLDTGGTWTNRLRCIVHLDRMARYFMFKSISNTSINNSGIDSNQLSPFADFYNKISVFDVNPIDNTDIGSTDKEIYFELQSDPKFFKKISNAWLELQSTSTTTVGTTSVPVTNVSNQSSDSLSTSARINTSATLPTTPTVVGTITNTQTNQILQTVSQTTTTSKIILNTNGLKSNGVNSPLMFAFSSLLDNNGNRLGGAGRAGVIMYGRELGYNVKTPLAVNSTTNNNVSNTSVNSTASISRTVSPSSLINIYDIAFKNASEVEGKSFDEQVIVIPAARIYAFNSSTASFEYRTYEIDVSSSNALTNSTTINYFESIDPNICFNNQYTKLYSKTPNVVTNKGLMYDEVNNMRLFVTNSNNSDLFALKSGSTTEYRSVPFKFLAKTNDSNDGVAILEVIFKFDNNVVLGSDSDYNTITSASNTTFIEYVA